MDVYKDSSTNWGTVFGSVLLVYDVKKKILALVFSRYLNTVGRDL